MHLCNFKDYNIPSKLGIKVITSNKVMIQFFIDEYMFENNRQLTMIKFAISRSFFE